MALAVKREDLVHVPWSSVEEWLQVYKQIYSGDLEEQNKACETLLVWKARLPKLPVGVECTLGLIQICLRDREWTPKINKGEMLVSYENDLRMMYSTIIMKFLNHISNIAHNKQTSLFIIAKQLNIPDWIVGLRHDIAHGHELPSIDVMRIVANILLTWLHEEYWAAEATNFEESQDFEDSDFIYSENEEILSDLIDIWTAIGLYIKVKFTYISDLPDTQIKNTLNDLFKKLKVDSTVNDKSELTNILDLLTSEISKNLSKSGSVKKEKIVIDCILNNEAFLTSSEILSIFIEEGSIEACKNCLPQSLLDYWKDFLLLLQEKKILLSLFLQLIEYTKTEKDVNKKLLASLWIKSVAQAYYKQKLVQQVYQTLEQKYDSENKKIALKGLIKNAQIEVEKCYPELTNVLNFNINVDFPSCLKDANFIKRLILHFNEFSEYFVSEIFKFLHCDDTVKEKLQKLMEINTLTNQVDKMDVEVSNEPDKVFTVEDIKKLEKAKETIKKKTEKIKLIADCKIRNTSWKIASENCDWSTCPIGILPWQINEIHSNDPFVISPSEIHYAIVKTLELPKIVDSNRLKVHSKIQWENLLKKKKKTKKKGKLSETNSATVMNTAISNVKIIKEQTINTT